MLRFLLFYQLYLILLKNCTNFQLIPDSLLCHSSLMLLRSLSILSFLAYLSCFSQCWSSLCCLKISITLLASHLTCSCIHICNHLLWLFSYILLLLWVNVPSIFSYACLDAALLFPLPFLFIGQISLLNLLFLVLTQTVILKTVLSQYAKWKSFFFFSVMSIFDLDQHTHKHRSNSMTVTLLCQNKNIE